MLYIYFFFFHSKVLHQELNYHFLKGESYYLYNERVTWQNSKKSFFDNLAQYMSVFCWISNCVINFFFFFFFFNFFFFFFFFKFSVYFWAIRRRVHLFNTIFFIIFIYIFLILYFFSSIRLKYFLLDNPWIDYLNK